MSDFDTLVRLADGLYSRYEAQGSPSDLSLCILHYRSALTLTRSTALSNDVQSKLLSNLANALSIRFQCHGDLADLDHSVECHVTALDFRPPGHPGRANTLSNFATALLIRYGQLAKPKDIELAIDYFRTALSILPPDGRLMPLMNYASALFSRFQHSGDASDLSDAIRQYHAVLDISPEENRATAYYNLANAVLARYKLERDPNDLALTIDYASVALQGMKDSHPDRVVTLSCLASALIRRFEWYGEVDDLQRAVEFFEAALALQDGPSQFMACYDLADALLMRYKLQGDLADLELGIAHYRTSLTRLPPNHRDEGVFLDNLGSALSLRFSRLGGLHDLEEAIQKHYFAMEMHATDIPRRVVTLEALGACLDVRFEQFRDPEDLHTAIDLYNEALVETSQDHPHRAAILTRSASSLVLRFRVYGDIADVDQSISYCHEARELLAPTHPDHVTACHTLASALLLRFEETGDEFDLDQAHIDCNAALNASCASDAMRAACHLLLARILKARVLPWDVHDTEPIFQHLRLAKDIGHPPLVSDVYAELASAHYLRFLVKQRAADLNDAFGHHELSMNGAIAGGGGGPSWPALRTCVQWVRMAETHGHRSGVDVYRSALRLVHRYVLAQRSPALRQCLARRYAAHLAADGAAFALRAGVVQAPMEAVEILEGGRSVVWAQHVRALTCLDELRLTGAHGAALADDYARLTFQLEQLPRSGGGGSGSGGATARASSSKDAKPLLKEKDAIVEQIRRVDGFRSFLKGTTAFSEVDKAGAEGPVVLLNASAQACDALVLQFNTPPTHVPLAHMTSRDVSAMAKRFRALMTGTTATTDECLAGLLSELWEHVVSPVVQHLVPHAPKGSRIWWCPAGPFASLPLHAAAPYRQGDPSTPTPGYIASYTPTLQALIRARSHHAPSSLPPGHHPPRAGRRSSLVPGFLSLKGKRSKQGLAGTAPQTPMSPPPSMPTTPTTTFTFAQPNVPTIVAIGHDDTTYELDHLRNRIPPGVPFRRVEGEEASRETVLQACREPGWLHLACPVAVVPGGELCDAGFVARDGVVSLHDIAEARPLAEFAFLAGRWEGAQDEEEEVEEEERIHLAAALQYAGIRSVVGTLWPVEDDVMRKVADAFYEQSILKSSGSTQNTDTAQSLNEALSAVDKEVPLAQRIAFIHVGA